MKKRALITGINGQDGSYLAELLLAKGYEVHGLVRRDAFENSSHRLVNIAHLKDQITLHVGAIDNHFLIHKLIGDIRPDECYHLGASSFVSYSLEDETSALAVNFNSTRFLLGSIKELAPSCKFYFSGSSEMFGEVNVSPQNEQTHFCPRSIYGISKVSSYHLTSIFKRNHGIFCSTGILYNHESPRRGFEFVTRKITSTVAKIKLGMADRLELGNLEVQRDWGYAPEYVQAMWMMLNCDEPADYVIATGKLHSVKQFADLAFQVVDLNYQKYVEVNPAYFRPTEAVPLCGDPSKARNLLNWSPSKKLEKVIEEMVLNDLKILKG